MTTSIYSHHQEEQQGQILIGKYKPPKQHNNKNISYRAAIVKIQKRRDTQTTQIKIISEM